MPSFDIVSEIDIHELQNAVDQANREIDNRFDFKGLNAKYTLNKMEITLEAPAEFQIKQMQDILQSKVSKRNIDIRVLDMGEIATNLSQAKQIVKIKQGIEQNDAKKIIKWLKDANLKVQGSIQGDQVRVTGKKRDDLQIAIQGLKKAELNLPMQFVNFRD